MLGAADVVGYLLDRGLLGPSAIVDGSLRVRDVSRRNQVFVVTAGGAQGYVLKVRGTAGDSSVAHEAAVLERLHSVHPRRSLRAWLPVLVGYDDAAGVLVLETTPGARDLRSHHGRGRFSCALAREAGRALAQLHAIPPTTVDGLLHAPRSASILNLHRPGLETVFALSEASVELTRIIQSAEGLCAELDELRANWSADAVIHGDVRWDNLIAVRSGSANRWTRLLLIDWELCGAGDPGFDIGAFFGEYLRAWLQSVPIADPRDPGRLLAHARLPLRRMRPALQAFWDAYTVQRGTSAPELNATLRRSTRFAAVRLLAAALEEAQTFVELRARALHLLTLSESMLRRPSEAADLFGLGASWHAA